MKCFLLFSLALITGCCASPRSVVAPNTPAKETVRPRVVEPVEKAISPVYQDGIHPTVRSWYYALHPHAFQCKDDPYACKECPVGKPNRVIDLPHGHYRDVPDEINLFFACSDINMLIPEHGGPDGDSFLCQREPADGYVRYHGHIQSCAPSKDNPPAQQMDLGTIQPGETKQLTIPMQVKP